MDSRMDTPSMTTDEALQEAQRALSERDATIEQLRAEMEADRKTFRDAYHWLNKGDIERAKIVLDAQFGAERREKKQARAALKEKDAL